MRPPFHVTWLDWCRASACATQTQSLDLDDDDYDDGLGVHFTLDTRINSIEYNDC
jgi:hypothetical protein